MANIGTNTNHLAGTGRSYNTPEKHFGKEIGVGKYQAQPEFDAKSLDVGGTVDSEYAAADSEKFDGELGQKLSGSMGESLELDEVLERAKELAIRAGEYVKKNPRIFVGAAIVLGAMGVGMMMRSRANR